MHRRLAFAVVAAGLAPCAVACSLVFGVGRDAVSGEPSPCGQPHRFCLDFDEGPLDGSPLHLFTQSGALTIDDASARSLPNALLATTAPLDGGASPAFASACSAFVGDEPHDMTLAFEIRVDQAATESDTAVAALGVGDPCGPDAYLVILAVTHAGTWDVSEYSPGPGGQGPGASTDHPTSFGFPGGWAKVVFQMHFASNMQPGSWASLTVNGQLVYDQQPITPSVGTGTPQFSVGLGSVYPPSDGWKIRFDDVTFDDGVVGTQ